MTAQRLRTQAPEGDVAHRLARLGLEDDELALYALKRPSEPDHRLVTELEIRPAEGEQLAKPQPGEHCEIDGRFVAARLRRDEQPSHLRRRERR